MSSHEFAERMRLLIGDQSIRNFAQKCELSDAAIRKYLDGKSEPSRTALIAIAKVAQVNIAWLVDGQGPMRPGGQQQENTGYDYVPLFDQSVSAGPGCTPSDRPPQQKLAFLHAWIKSKGLSVKDLFLLPVSGESMEPTLSQGDVVLVDKSTDHVHGEGLYVLRLDNHLYIKRLQRLPGGAIAVISDNPAYERFTIGPGATEDAAIIGRVVWIGREV